MGRIFGHVDVDNNWVPALSFLMHLGLCDLQSEAKSWEPCSFTKFQTSPILRLFNILWVHEKGVQICTSG